MTPLCLACRELDWGCLNQTPLLLLLSCRQVIEQLDVVASSCLGHLSSLLPCCKLPTCTLQEAGVELQPGGHPGHVREL